MKSMIISLDGWAAGERTFRFHADTEFFQAFDNKEILEAGIDVEIKAVKEGTRKVKADLHLSGTLTVLCDRCLEPLEIQVDTRPEEEFEAPSTESDWDFSQAVYDYACLSVPIHKVHPEGGCNPDTVKFLSHDGQKDEEAAPSSPFSALKGLFESK
ncbi:MAG: hypothetical protein IJV32_05725 [Bacteroidales bacterium]|nr:hypothetical protein [Bacteroidales bacterium]